MDFLLFPTWRTMQQVVMILLAVCLLSCSAVAQDEEEDEDLPEYLPGLVARYTGSDEKTYIRCDKSIAMNWGAGSPDERIPAGPFRASWIGDLLIQVPGKYRLYLFAQGNIDLKVNGKQVLRGTSTEPRWFESDKLDFSFGYLPLELTFEKTGRNAEIVMFWSGPKFQLEPLVGRWLFHYFEDAEQIDYSFQRGQLLTRAMRCSACHEIPAAGPPIAAPALNRLPGHLSHDWLVQWLTSGPAKSSQKKERKNDPSTTIRRMPHFGLSAADAKAIAAFLCSPAAGKQPRQQDAPKLEGNKTNGQTLFRSSGCIACHTTGALGSSGLFGGSDLSKIGKKRPPQFFAKWLKNPASINQDHRMPTFKFPAKQRNDLALYLASLGKPNGEAGNSEKPDLDLRKRGRQLIVQHRCNSCHRLPADKMLPPPAEPNKLTALSHWNNSCAGDTDKLHKRPAYGLSDKDQRAIRTYITQSLPRQNPTDSLTDGRFVLIERNCIGCHQRGEFAGLSDDLVDVAKHDPSLATILPALKPPSLNSVGDKFHEQALSEAITLDQKPRRGWLKVQMPKFPLAEEEKSSLIRYLVSTDRIPERKNNYDSPAPAALDIAGPRLVTSNGFGCTSCHQIGKVAPVKVELKAHGPNLSMLGSRVRRSWYDRWVRNPSRIVPRMEMPAVQIPIRGVLHDNIDAQLAAVWHVLNKPDFTPPKPNAIRVIRRTASPESEEQPIAMMENLEIGKQVFVRPLVVALPNRHNVLYDVEAQRLAGWWIGDTARQRTRGKYWYWESAGSQLLPVHAGKAELQLILGNQAYAPSFNPALPLPIDVLEDVPAGLQFTIRVPFTVRDGSGEKKQLVVRNRQTITAIAKSAAPEDRSSEALSANRQTGFRRRWRLSGLAPNAVMRIQIMPQGSYTLHTSGRILTTARLEVSLITKDVRIENRTVPFVDIRANGQGRAELTLDYVARVPVDQYLRPSIPKLRLPKKQFAAVPGFETTQLPLPEEIMPTALAWRKDGALLVGTLKGRLFVATDSDQDGLEDRLSQIGHQMIAPYGIAAIQLPDGSEAIDVTDKKALLRLYDRNQDGRYERMETVATGWGHGTDYHGWVVGLPRDEQGNYYIGVSQRKGPDGHMRGTTMKLVPRTPTRENPLRYRIETLSYGSRFQLGIARNRAGAVFITDNQGQYTPYNELNHVRPGVHFGFISPQDSQARTNQKKTGPAIAIPHPWTRSVNGICFLETPEPLRKQTGKKFFGPLEGHLVGCEINTRRLIRMSLQKVGDTYQGAAYPLSLPENEEQEITFMGPVVCQVAPDGDLYVGSLRDSGWNTDRNIGQLTRVRFSGKLPAGIAEMRSTDKGFTIDFTQPVDPRLATDPANYSLESFRRVATPEYGGDDKDRQREKILSATVSKGGLRVTLKLARMRRGHVYELRVKKLVSENRLFHPAEAYFSLGPIPQ